MNLNFNNDFDTEMARCLKDVRRVEGISAEEFGKRIGLTQNYITRIENGGIKNPSFDTVVKLAYELSKTNAIMHFDVKLTDYKTPFVDLIYCYLHQREIESNYTIQANENILSEITLGMDHLDESDLTFIADYVSFKRYSKAIHSLFYEASKIGIQDEGFAYWLLNSFGNLLNNHSKIRDDIDKQFRNTKATDRINIDKLFGYIFNTLTLFVSNQSASLPKE
ncbi:helix-turn-helix transcriptional regulator [Dehalobacter sp.]|uniref:helix-turn-helix domain-containing protein n=1 Tax=Dehalobacter sp. TaxID=1962289 RepID=UPI00258DEA47|nr:helix-turn-helix transcriptional regulator [Dehalobacter sp.]MDJ0305112.1 helix-turn-helix transcriptional regulator [Dehalobacter sp.]